MLAAHRDQENLVHTTQVPTKQQPKTPGARYPKTPLASRNNDENVSTTFAGKTGLAGGGGATTRAGRNDKLMAKGTGKGPAMVTPMDTRIRAPLGNKTTNAKARTDRGAGVKDIVKEIEQTQTKQTTVQKPKQKPAELGPAKLAILSDGESPSGDWEEPEYAPPQPAPLPYESDVLPRGGLTFEGLNKNFLKGFYEHFHNPVDETGVSREETKFQEEMQAVLKQAEERNEREAASLDWNIEDLVETEPSTCRRPAPDRESAPYRSGLIKRAPQTNPPTIASRRAASALAISADIKKPVMAGPQSRSTSTRKPLSALISGSRAKQFPTMSRPAPLGNSAGEAASRTTIGYNKGRAASSMIHSQGGSQASGPGQAFKPSGTRDADLQLTVTPARMRQTASGTQSTAEALPQLQFLSIFGDVDDEDLPSLPTPYLSSDDEDDEFEMQLTI
ncbi:hypothetical protein G6O67_004107 [Ophiocordyceps sinensis]|uniref:Uncharacterized protein n=2 Tax=Ophiocordyceps sinensis TaxID=72228 RepID=A0A8H4LY72_9HYPO|nr:hypothetical protein OCS_04025 [Ophiocordyceps sinensis CO18]KAF4507628.1 hypothetical protein G6O67_004107 [Ophiocordyceps sinensis]